MDEKTVTALLHTRRAMGAEFLKNTQRVAAFLKDFLPAHPGERHYGECQVLVRLLEMGVPQQLAAHSSLSDAEFAALARQWAAALYMNEQAVHQALRIWHFVAHAGENTSLQSIDIASILGTAAHAAPSQPQPPQPRMDEKVVAALLRVKRVLCDEVAEKKRVRAARSGVSADIDVDAVILSDARRWAQLLTDYLPASPGEHHYGARHVLQALLAADVPGQLKEHPLSSEAEYAALAAKWAAALFLDERAAHQAVRVWQFVVRANATDAIDIQAILGTAPQTPPSLSAPPAPQPPQPAPAAPPPPSQPPQPQSQPSQRPPKRRLPKLAIAAAVVALVVAAAYLLPSRQPPATTQPATASRQPSATAPTVTLAAPQNSLSCSMAVGGGAATPLIYSTIAGDTENVACLLKTGENAKKIINTRGNRGATALMHAATAGHTDIARLLLAAGANTEIADIEGHTALIRATIGGHSEIVQLLLGAGANIHTADAKGIQALVFSAVYGHTDIAKTLLAAGADASAKTPDGYTALMPAARNGHTEIVRLLLAANTDANAKTDTGESALQLAQSRGHSDIVRLLQDAGAQQ